LFSDIPNPAFSGGQCLVGSLSGADASQKVTEALTKVGLIRMETGLDVQRHKPA